MKKLWFLLALAALPQLGRALVTVSAAAITHAANATTNTFNITTGSAPNRLLFISAQSTNGGGYNTVSSITLNGSNATFLKRTQDTSGAVGNNLEAWYYPNPAASTVMTVTITFSASNANIAAALEYKGVNLSSPWGATVTSSAHSSPLTTTITTTTSNSLIIFNYGMYLNTGTTLDSNYTSRAVVVDAFSDSIGIADRLMATPGTSNATNSYTGVYGQSPQQLLELLAYVSNSTRNMDLDEQLSPDISKWNWASFAFASCRICELPVALAWPDEAEAITQNQLAEQRAVVKAQTDQEEFWAWRVFNNGVISKAIVTATPTVQATPTVTASATRTPTPGATVTPGIQTTAIISQGL